MSAGRILHPLWPGAPASLYDSSSSSPERRSRQKDSLQTEVSELSFLPSRSKTESSSTRGKRAIPKAERTGPPENRGFFRSAKTAKRGQPPSKKSLQPVIGNFHQRPPASSSGECSRLRPRCAI